MAALDFPSSPTVGQIYTANGNSWTWDGTSWLSTINSPAGGALLVNATTATSSYTVASGYNALSVGPITVASGVSVTVSSGQRWVVL